MVTTVVISSFGPFFLKGPNGQPLMQLSDLNLPNPVNWLGQLKGLTAEPTVTDVHSDAVASLTASGQKFYKWKDANGIWQFTTVAPVNQNFDTVMTDPDANVIQALSQDTINETLGVQVAAENPDTQKGLESAADALTATTIPIKQIPKLLDDAKKARVIMEQRNEILDQL